MKSKTVLGMTLTLLLASMLGVWMQTIVAQPPSGMISYWRLDDGEGTTADDSIGTNDGTLVNGPVWTTGKVGNALDFDGVDDYVDCGIITYGEVITLSAWVNDIGTTGSAWKTLFQSKGFQFGISSGNIALWSDSAYRSWHGGPVSQDVWHHLVYEVDSTTDTGKFYIDGEFDSSFTTTAYDTGNPTYIGRFLLLSPPHASSFPVQFWKGLIDEVAIYNRALTPEEIQQHYQNGLNGLGYYIEGIEATINIDPDTLNLKSQGQWITAFTTLPEGYSVGDVDVATVELGHEDVVVEAADWGEVQDGVLMVKFDRATLRDYLGEVDVDSGEKFYDITLTVQGNVAGTPFEGSDTITVKRK